MIHSWNGPGIAREPVGPYACVGARASRRVRDRRQETGLEFAFRKVSYNLGKSVLASHRYLGPGSLATADTELDHRAVCNNESRRWWR